MAVLKLTKSDLKFGKVIRPARYRAKIVDVTTKPAKTDGSNNYLVNIIGLDGEAQDIKFVDNISEKALGRFRPILEALGVPIPEGEDLPIDTDMMRDREIGIDVGNETYQGRVRNRINGYFAV